MRIATVLDVNPDVESLAWEQDLLRRFDTEVFVCAGPESIGGCPLLRHEECRLLDHVDGVLFQLDLDRPEHRQILAHYTREVDIPIRVVVTEDQRHRWERLLEDVEVFTPPVGPAKLDAFAAEVESEIDDE